MERGNRMDNRFPRELIERMDREVEPGVGMILRSINGAERDAKIALAAARADIDRVSSELALGRDASNPVSLVVAASSLSWAMSRRQAMYGMLREIVGEPRFLALMTTYPVGGSRA
jgi:hypothetical protein